jgi:hypothetical protein
LTYLGWILQRRAGIDAASLYGRRRHLGCGVVVDVVVVFWKGGCEGFEGEREQLRVKEKLNSEQDSDK